MNSHSSLLYSRAILVFALAVLTLAPGGGNATEPTLTLVRNGKTATAPKKQLPLAIEQTYVPTANHPDTVQHDDIQFHQTEKMAWRHLGTCERMAAWINRSNKSKPPSSRRNRSSAWRALRKATGPTCPQADGNVKRSKSAE